MEKSGASEGNRTLCTLKTPMINSLKLLKFHCYLLFSLQLIEMGNQILTILLSLD